MNQRDLELLSDYLDGQLSPTDSARLESRLSVDLELAAALKDIRLARGLLRRMPKRKAPRNFTLTRKMVAAKPPMPQSFSLFRLASGLAVVLFAFSIALNTLFAPAGFAAPVLELAGSAATAAPAPTQAPAAAAPVASDSARQAATETPQASLESQAQNGAAPNPQPIQPKNAVPEFPLSIWQSFLLVTAIGSALIAFAIKRAAKRKWS